MRLQDAKPGDRLRDRRGVLWTRGDYGATAHTPGLDVHCRERELDEVEMRDGPFTPAEADIPTPQPTTVRGTVEPGRAEGGR